MKPRIGLTTYARNEDNEFHLPAEYLDAVVGAGGVPLMLPPVDIDVTAWLQTCDGLILTGGGDLDPSSYSGPLHETNYMMDRQRDDNELALARAVLRDRLPTLAICRHAQVLNVVLGGTIIPHVPEAVGEKVAHRLPPRIPTPHTVRIEPDSQLANVLGCTECTPMSWHHQAIAQPGSGLRTVAQAPDGVIEAVELPGASWLVAVQWHPELTAAEDPIQQRLFNWLVQAAVDPPRQTSAKDHSD